MSVSTALRSLGFVLLYLGVVACDPITPIPPTNSGGSAGAGGDVQASSSSSSSSATGSTSSSGNGAGGSGGGNSGGGGMGGSPKPECSMDSECAGNPNGSVCEMGLGVCVECLDDAQCTNGLKCKSHHCVPECSDADPCAAGLSCCNGFCRDALTDNAHCGVCNQVCASTVDSERTCMAGICTMTACKPYFYDCNSNPADGCEQVDTKDPCVCSPGTTQSCYQGEPGTLGVGRCVAGTQTCKANGLEWTPCQGQVLPQWEICNNQVDDDCNGLVDDDTDLDGDGWTICTGDCAEYGMPGLYVNPKFVNPGAMEVLYNGIDDDCDPTSSDTQEPPTCSSGEKLANVAPEDLVKALDLCRFTTENAPLPVRRWGVIDAQFLHADGSVPNAAELDEMQNAQTAVLEHYGDLNHPFKGATWAGLSTGRMRDTVHHGYGGSTSFSSTSNLPEALLSEYGGTLPHPANCPVVSQAHDSVNLRIRIRVPTNTYGLAFAALFGTEENAQIACATGDDFALGYVAPRPTGLLPGMPANTLDDGFANPLSANLTNFLACNPGPVRACPEGPSRLSGTPMQRVTRLPNQYVPVDPGTTMTFDFMVFDAENSDVDSVLLLDGFSFVLNGVCWPPDSPARRAGQSLHCH